MYLVLDRRLLQDALGIDPTVRLSDVVLWASVSSSISSSSSKRSSSSSSSKWSGSSLFSRSRSPLVNEEAATMGFAVTYYHLPPQRHVNRWYLPKAAWMVSKIVTLAGTMHSLCFLQRIVPILSAWIRPLLTVILVACRQLQQSILLLSPPWHRCAFGSEALFSPALLLREPSLMLLTFFATIAVGHIWLWIFRVPAVLAVPVCTARSFRRSLSASFE